MAFHLANRVYLPCGDFDRPDLSSLEEGDFLAIRGPDEQLEGALGAGQWDDVHVVKPAQPQLTAVVRFRMKTSSSLLVS